MLENINSNGESILKKNSSEVCEMFSLLRLKSSLWGSSMKYVYIDKTKK